jgi:Starch-binding associating with outer membrane
MRHSLRVVLGLGLVLSAAGCSDYLSGPGIASTSDPNNITTLTQPGPLYASIQQAGPPQRQGQLARIATEYTQQIAGVARQQIGFDRYQATPTDLDSYFGAIYGATSNLTGGGALLDIHKMIQLARKQNDSIFVGVGKVYEAMVIGFAADFWGDIPYRQAADSNIRTPTFDPQLQIYADMQTQLDSAIKVYLPATGPTNAGPAVGGTELVYLGNATPLPTLYAEVAHSLKARYYMHVAAASVKGVTGAPANAYALALAEAQLGISSAADNFLWFANATTSGNNIWWQFNSARTGDIAPGAAVIEIMKRRIGALVDDSARINFYFTKTEDSSFYGARPSGTTGMTTNPGINNGSGSPGGNFSQFGPFIDPNITDGSFRMGEITYAETQLIAAEATWHLNGGGADPTVPVAAAATFLNNAHADRTYGSQTFTGSAGAIPTPTLQNIIEEKYVQLYLNPEVWNDYKRTCLPSLAPVAAAGSKVPGANPIPGRVPYGLTEINANPNTPTASSVGVAISSVSLNANEPAFCPVLNYTSSTPLGN